MALRLSSMCVLTILVGCTQGDKGGADTAETEKDSGDGGSGTMWRPAGTGTAYFVDGDEDNSLFHLEMERAVEPREGEDYYGFITRGGDDPIELDDIDVESEDFTFEADVGFNAVIEGYDGFEAWANDTGERGDGDALWVGAIDTNIYTVIQDLLIYSESTPSGEGTLRATETLVAGMQVLAQDTIEGAGDIDSVQSAGEQIYNGILGLDEDLNNSMKLEINLKCKVLWILIECGYQ